MLEVKKKFITYLLKLKKKLMNNKYEVSLMDYIFRRYQFIIIFKFIPNCINQQYQLSFHIFIYNFLTKHLNKAKCLYLYNIIFTCKICYKYL